MDGSTKVLIVLAHENEYSHLLSSIKATALIEKKYYAFDQGWIVISGVGTYSAQMAVSQYGGKCDEIWNIGFAGYLHGERAIGEILSIEQVGKYVPLDEDELDKESKIWMEKALPSLEIEGKGGRLISSDFPIHTERHRSRLADKWDGVDMEGYGVAFSAKWLGKKCRIWKIISDFASPGGRELIKKNRVLLSQKIADLVIHTVYEKNHESRSHSIL
ncbi:MAG: hypothetical protein WAM28_00625 [Chlamydiales bacterium]